MGYRLGGNMQSGITISEYLKNIRYGINGKSVAYNGVRYTVGFVREDGLVELYTSLGAETPCAIASSDLIEFTGE